ncbi:unnamed protein product [Cuscuta epithymum]|uniref:Nudix hydrolase domain-containing protein n=1 Tax=Cuscuta epithymum TaxID=186058 RepID=A0AAV0CJN7_9ASTE|nr:unnamed protein product [Cuscuta epithymum]
MEVEKVVSMLSRTGRDLQRYNADGCRQVVGCIPYRYRKANQPICGTKAIDDLEFLLVSSQRCPRMMFPKGGWEEDESLEEAAHRETFEEAGVWGNIGNCLGSWYFKSKSKGTFHEGFMLPLFVTDEMDHWPEENMRRRLWVSYKEAMDLCFHPWMKEALDCFISQLNLSQRETTMMISNSTLLKETLKNKEEEEKEEDDVPCHTTPESRKDEGMSINEEEPRMCLSSTSQSLQAKRGGGILISEERRIVETSRTMYSLQLSLITEVKSLSNIALCLQRMFAELMRLFDPPWLGLVAQGLKGGGERPTRTTTTSDELSDDPTTTGSLTVINNDYSNN